MLESIVVHGLSITRLKGLVHRKFLYTSQILFFELRLLPQFAVHRKTTDPAGDSENATENMGPAMEA